MGQENKKRLKSGIIRKKGIFFGLLFGSLALIIVLTLYIESLERANTLRQRKISSFQTLTAIQSSLESEFSKSLFQLKALSTYISVNPEMSEEEFTFFGQNLFKQESHAVSLGAAPGMVIKYVYPFEKNKAAIGLRYSDMPLQKEDAYLAKDTEHYVMTGPLEAVQGGRVLIVREPVYYAKAVGDHAVNSFWGLASLLIDANALFDCVYSQYRSYPFALRLLKADGSVGDVFYGNQTSFTDNDMILSIVMPGATWQLSTAFKYDQSVLTREIIVIRLIGLFLFLAVITFFVIRKRHMKEQEIAQDNLEYALKEAEKANRTKSEFLANMSHELRTPLNAIIGFSDLIRSRKNNKFSDDKIDEYAGDINDSGLHLLGIINGILDLSKVEAGSFDMTIETIYIRDIAEYAVHLTQNSMGKGGLRIINKIPIDLPSIQSDERMIRQILLNLLSNAIKFTATGGCVTLFAEALKDNSIRMIVEDTGIGMSRDDIVIAMQNFGQVDGHLSRSQQGTGLGLPLVKAFVELLGGEFYIQSLVGVGTKVSLIFPDRIPNRGSESL